MVKAQRILRYGARNDSGTLHRHYSNFSHPPTEPREHRCFWLAKSAWETDIDIAKSDATQENCHIISSEPSPLLSLTAHFYFGGLRDLYTPSYVIWEIRADNIRGRLYFVEGWCAPTASFATTNLCTCVMSFRVPVLCALALARQGIDYLGSPRRRSQFVSKKTLGRTVLSAAARSGTCQQRLL